MRTHTRLLTTALTAAALVVAVASCARTPAGTVASLSGVASTSASAPASASPSATAGLVRDSTQINGVLVAAGGLDLSVDYVGGDCDVSASADAVDTSPTITVHVLVKRSGGMCEAVGYARTATAVLDSPWNGRRIVDATGATVPTMDATQLLQPTWLPPGYVAQGIAHVGSADGNVFAAETWSIPSYGPSPNGTSCTPSQDALSVAQGFGIAEENHARVPGTFVVNGRPATLERANDAADTGDLWLTWAPPSRPSGWAISVASLTQCLGDVPLSSDAVLRFANGLR